MKKTHLKHVIKEQTEKTVKQCPAPTQNLELNTANRNRAIKADFIKYGPLNLSDEGYWEEYAKKWGETTSAEEAKNSNCSKATSRGTLSLRLVLHRHVFVNCLLCLCRMIPAGCRLNAFLPGSGVNNVCTARNRTSAYGFFWSLFTQVCN